MDVIGPTAPPVGITTSFARRDLSLGFAHPFIQSAGDVLQAVLNQCIVEVFIPLQTKEISGRDVDLPSAGRWPNADDNIGIDGRLGFGLSFGLSFGLFFGLF